MGRVLNRIQAATPLVYESFEAASAGVDGYEDPGVIKAVAAKTATFRKEIQRRITHRLTVQDLLVLHRVSHGSPVRVLDLGGACGATFFELKALAPDAIESWVVVETKPMVEQARGFEGGALRFSSDLDGELAESPDLVIAKGVLHYTKDPGSLLRQLTSSTSSYVYLSRTPAFDQPRLAVFIRQSTRLRNHGPGLLPDVGDRRVSLPATVISWSSYLGAAHGAEVLWEFEEGNQWRLRAESVRDMGMLLSLR